MSSPQILLALWVLQPALQAVAAIIFFRRQLHKDFPVFLSFTVTQIAIFAVEFPVYRWRSPAFGVALGFGVLAGAQLITNALYSGAHISADTMNLVNLTTYNACLVLWCSYALLNRRETRVPVLVPQRWDEALMDIQPHADSESLIPMFEHMVDRAFSRAQNHRV